MRFAALLILLLGVPSCRTTSLGTSNLSEARMGKFLFKTSADKKYIQRYRCLGYTSSEAETCSYDADDGYSTHVDYLKKQLGPLIAMKNEESAKNRNAELRPYAEKLMQARAKVTPFYEEKEKNQKQIDEFKKDNTEAALKQIQALEERNTNIDKVLQPLERDYNNENDAYDRKATELAKATSIDFEKFFTEIYAVVESQATYQASLNAALKTNLGILNEAIEQVWNKKILGGYGWVRGSNPPEGFDFNLIYAYPTGVAVYSYSRNFGRGPKIAGFSIKSIDENGAGEYSYSNEADDWRLKPDPNDKAAYLITRSGSSGVYKISLIRPRNSNSRQ